MLLISSIQSRQPQVVVVVDSAVGCRYFLPGPQLPSQLQSIIAIGCNQFILLGEQRSYIMVNRDVKQ